MASKAPRKQGGKSAVAPAVPTAAPVVPFVDAAAAAAVPAPPPAIVVPPPSEPVSVLAGADPVPPPPAAAPDIAPTDTIGEPALPPSPPQEDTSMTDTIETVKQQGEQFASELKGRTEEAMAKSKALLGDASDFGKGNVEALVESGKIAAKGFEKMGQDAADYVRRSFECTTSAFKGMAQVKSPTELFKLQGDFMRSSFDMFVAEASRSTEASLKLAGDIAQPISNRMAVAAEKVKLAA